MMVKVSKLSNSKAFQLINNYQNTRENMQKAAQFW